jgi:aryl-alcohol dehydrogenase-like predicted oxidoreductase
MGMSQSYGVPDDKESVATLHRAIELGVTFLDTAEAYGPFTNEELLGRALEGRRDAVVLATKFASASKVASWWAPTAGPSTSAKSLRPRSAGWIPIT